MDLRLPHDPAAFVPHPLHGPDAAWPDTNCALDMMVEVVALSGNAPEAAALAAVSGWFQGDQWSTFEFHRGDLVELYGLEVTELTPFRGLLHQLQTHLDAGRLMSMEADAWFLPDTRGVSHHLEHTKTGLIPLAIDADARRMVYLHNAGMAEVSGDDFDGVFSTDPSLTHVPMPYLELVRRVGEPSTADTRSAALRVLREQVARRPEGNPVTELSHFLADEVVRLQQSGDEAGFHKLAFVTTRQLGTSAQFAGQGLRWLREPELAEASDQLLEVSGVAKSAQFSLARASRGRKADMVGVLAPAADLWASALESVARWARA